MGSVVTDKDELAPFNRDWLGKVGTNPRWIAIRSSSCLSRNRMRIFTTQPTQQTEEGKRNKEEKKE